jgi:hypothetical protein
VIIAHCTFCDMPGGPQRRLYDPSLLTPAAQRADVAICEWCVERLWHQVEQQRDATIDPYWTPRQPTEEKMDELAVAYEEDETEP